MYKSDNTYWWQEPKANLYNSVFDYIKHLDKTQSYSTEENLRNMRLYGNIDAASLRNYAFYRSEPTSIIQNRVTLNVIQSMVDTMTSKITKNKPKPTFLTDGGDWSLQRRAKKLTQFVEGQFQATDFYSKAAIAFQDSAIFGTGAIKIFRDGRDIKTERILIDELCTDDAEAVYGDPRQMHQKKFIHRDVLKELFPKSAHKIDALSSADLSQYSQGTYDRSTNMVLVVESWHLPSGKDADDGKHSICIANETLFEEEWTKDYFPFVFFRYCLRPIGFWGQGLAEQLRGIQLEINKILRTIQVSMHLVSVPKLLVENTSKIVSAHLNNKIGGIIKFTGTPPSYASLGQVPAELFTHLDRLYSRAYEIAGISQLSAQSEKPSGLDSGKALRTYNNIETERFMALGVRYEKCFITASRLMIDLAKEIAEEEGEYAVKAQTGSFFSSINWSDVEMDEDKYLMQVFPTSSLSSDPTGRLNDVQDLMKLGFLSKEDAMKLLDYPDLKQFYNFNNAGVEDIERAIELIIDKDEYQTPEPYQNLDYGIVKMQQAYLLYKSQGAPEETLELFRRWIEDANALIKKAAAPETLPPPEAAPPMPSEVAPPALPGTAPVM